LAGAMASAGGPGLEILPKQAGHTITARMAAGPRRSGM
jgi:hypothetical protein